MQDIIERFHKNNIPYKEIDKEMIEMIDILNFKCNLKTKFCCFGHQTREPIIIIFDESIKEEDIENLLLNFKFSSICWINNDLSKVITASLSFNKWVRYNYCILKNWTMEIKITNSENMDDINDIKIKMLKYIIELLN
jgi:hypothetical protein